MIGRREQVRISGQNSSDNRAFSHQNFISTKGYSCVAVHLRSGASVL